jgi:hypothetical protein
MHLMEGVQLFSTIVQVLVSIVLVIVTARYVALTKKIGESNRRSAQAADGALQEIVKQRLNSWRPFLTASSVRATLFQSAPEVIEIEIINCGLGPACSISITYRSLSVRMGLDSPSAGTAVLRHNEKESRFTVRLLADRGQLSAQRDTGPRLLGNLDLAYFDVNDVPYTTVFGISFDGQARVSVDRVQQSTEEPLSPQLGSIP